MQTTCCRRRAKQNQTFAHYDPSFAIQTETATAALCGAHQGGTATWHAAARAAACSRSSGIWDGHQLVAWTTFHRESIQVAKACHQALNIERPQLQLRGSYAKPVWDPDSAIWREA